MMLAANMPIDIKQLIYCKAIATATRLDGLVQVELNGVTKSRYKHEFGKNPPFVDHLRTWGKLAQSKSKQQPAPKKRIQASTALWSDMRTTTLAMSIGCGTPIQHSYTKFGMSFGSSGCFIRQQNQVST